MSSEGFSFDSAQDATAETGAFEVSGEDTTSSEPGLVENPIAWEVQCGRCGQSGHDSGECTNE